MIAVIVLIFMVLIIFVANIKIVPQANAYIIERLGAYYQTWGTGLHMKIPFVDEKATHARDFSHERLHEATDAWGIKINRVELKNIDSPREIQNAMERQMKAEREKQEQILKAEGKKKASILDAEGEKESAILRAEAKKQTAIREAEGEAEAIIKVQTAIAEGIRKINESNPSQAYLTMKSLESFEKAADGKATKIIIPSEIQGIAGLATAMKEVVRK